MLTAANSRGLSPEQQRTLVPLEDVAEAIAFLCSPEAGALSGSVLKFPPVS
jgi:NAD(P)-dependent dehydrogenase (short-subunit alcohol dehydrogenase family)